MGKRRNKKMGETAKVYDFYSQTKKNKNHYTQVMPIKKLSKESMKSSASFKKREEERD